MKGQKFVDYYVVMAADKLSSTFIDSNNFLAMSNIYYLAVISHKVHDTDEH